MVDSSNNTATNDYKALAEKIFKDIDDLNRRAKELNKQFGEYVKYARSELKKSKKKQKG